MREASAHLDYIERFHGRRPWVHLMRGNGRFHDLVRFDSADSVNAARNCHQHKEAHGERRAKFLADRISEKIHDVSYGSPSGTAYPTDNFEEAR